MPEKPRHELWNEDGSPKRPVPPDTDDAFRSIIQSESKASEREAYMSYARAKQEFKRGTPATIGDVVHFWDGERCRAGMVAEIEMYSHACTIHVFIPNEACQWWHADHSEEKETNTWHWAEDA
jgi:hypothetical protein